MARILKTFTRKRREPGPGREAIYPWDKWLNGQIWALKQDDDYHMTRRSFRVAIYRMAKKRKIKVTVHYTDEGVVIHPWVPPDQLPKVAKPPKAEPLPDPTVDSDNPFRHASSKTKLLKPRELDTEPLPKQRKRRAKTRKAS
jgi:hypothetical protein